MTKYKLHCFCQSGNAYKVALYLACAGLDWEPVFVDFMNGQTRTQEWRAGVNEMGEAPVLDTGTRKLTQSGAILTWLAERHGRFAPQGEDERHEALRWILFDNHKFTSYFATHRFLRSLAPSAPDPAVLAFLKGRADASLAVVESHLSRQPFIVADRPTIADFSLAGYMFYPGEETGYDLKATHPALHAWTERLRALPGWRGPYELMPGTRFIQKR
jgi:glutathione S-transferase